MRSKRLNGNISPCCTFFSFKGSCARRGAKKYSFNSCVGKTHLVILILKKNEASCVFSLVGFLPPNMTQGFSVSWLRKGGEKLVFAAKLECLDVDFQALSTRNECVIQVMPGPPRS